METPQDAPVEPRPLQVSVLVISQQQKPLLAATLTALAARTKPELSEVIVVDCGSQDGSAHLDEEFQAVTFLRLPRNFGWTRAVNIGCRTAKGQYLLLLPNGVTVTPDAIQRLLAALEQQPAAGAACPAGTFYALPKPGETALRPVSPESAEYPFDQPVLIPKVALASMNYFPDSYGQFYADLELFHKIREAGKRLVVLPDLVLPRQSAPQELMDEETLAADRIHGLAVYYGRNYGFLSGFTFRLRAGLQALATLRLGLAAKVLSGSKVDGL
jgi:GT2 family glycosyltransferase